MSQLNALDGIDGAARFEVATGVDPAPLTSNAAAHEDCFTVMLGSGLSLRHGVWQARAFKQLAIVQLSAAELTILTSSNHCFQPNTESALSLSWDRIFNVVSQGKLVQFAISTENGVPQAFVLRAKNAEQARALASALPTRSTEAFATERNKVSLFLSRTTEEQPYCWATWLLIGINVFVYLSMGLHGGGWFLANPLVALNDGSNFGPYTFHGEEWRLISSAFIHFGFVHIFMNMLVLAQVGRVVERLFGSWRFLLIYFFATLSGSLMSLTWHFEINSAGASGAIFGVLGALLAYALREGRSLPKAVYLRHLRFSLVFIAYNLISGLSHTGIDNGAHVGGLIGGMLMGWLLAKPLGAAPKRAAKPSGVSIGAMVDGMSAVLALGLLAGTAIYFAPSSGRQDELRYLHTLFDLQHATRRAMDDTQRYGKVGESPQELASLARHIKDELLPEWDYLYQRVDANPVPVTSSLYLYRDATLHFYDDMRQLLHRVEDAIEQNRISDPHERQEIEKLGFDMQQQTLWIKQNNTRYLAEITTLLKGAR